MAEFACCCCQSAIKGVRLRCNVCRDYDLCLQCFSCGAETGKHKKEHDYELRDNGDVPIINARESSWTSSDEINLLTAVEQYGYGNWEDTANHIQTKTPLDTKEHFETYYIHGNIGQNTFSKIHTSKVVDHTGTRDNGPLSPSITLPLPPLELTQQEKQELGYMPYRDDFEREYDNEAETILSSLSVGYNDDEIDTVYKLARVSVYRERIRERIRRKRFAREYSLIGAATALGMKHKTLQTQGNKKKYTRVEREFGEKMRIFSQFHSSIEHDKYFENLKKEKDVKIRIKELMRYRKNGITSIDECSDFEDERCRREKKKQSKKKMSSPQAKRTSMNSQKAEDNVDSSSLSDSSSGEKQEVKSEVRRKPRKISSLPGNDLLTERETKLCNSIGMSPGNYLTIKTCIIKDYLQRRQGHPVKFRYPSGFDKTHRRKIMSFLTNNGWIDTGGLQYR